MASRWAPLALPALVMLAVGVWGLGRGWWFDEVVTVTVAPRSVTDILQVARHIDAVHAAYYLLMHVWLELGSGERWSRVPSLVAAAATAALVASLGRRLVSARAGLLAGLLFAISPFVTTYAQEARSYTLVGLAVLGGTWILLRALDDGGRWWLAYPAVMVVATVLHEFAALAVAAHGVTLLLARPARAVWLRWLPGAVVVGCVLLPLALFTSSQVGQVGGLNPPSWPSLRRFVLHLGGSAPVVVVVVLVLVVVGCTVAGRGPVRPAALALPLLLLPAALLILVSFVHPLFGARYVFYAVGALCLLAGAGADRLLAATGAPRAVAAVAAAGVLAALFVLEVPELRSQHDPGSWPADLKGAARVVGSHAHPGDGVVFFPSTFRAVALGYPDGFAGTTDVGLAVDPVASDSLLGVDRPPSETAAALPSRQRVWVVGRLGDEAAGGAQPAVELLDALRRDFRPTPGIRLHGVTVQLWTRRS